MTKSSIAVVVLNWNDADLLPHSVGSLFEQTMACDIIVVDNGSSDNSRSVIEAFGSKVTPLFNKKNLGFAGGVNTGIRYALEAGYAYIALLNNDAVAEPEWVAALQARLKQNPQTGGVTSRMLHQGDNTYDSTGEIYTRWGLPYPRGREEVAASQYDDKPLVSAVSGGGSMFRAQLFREAGLFDEDFFAYYEDVDLGLRGQLGGWQFEFVPNAVLHHATGSTSGRIKGFTTYQAFKNMPWVVVKNVPFLLLFTVLPRFILIYIAFFITALQRRHLKFAFKGALVSFIFLPKKLWQRFKIQRHKVITTSQFANNLQPDLPPKVATEFQKLKSKIWKKG